MDKLGLEINIPNFRDFAIRRIVTDYTGTLSVGGKLTPGIGDRLRQLNQSLDIIVISADSFGTAAGELAAIPLHPRILPPGTRHDEAKESCVMQNSPSNIAAFGNGNNDALMLKAVKNAGGLAIAVDNGEGCAVEAMLNASIFVVNIANALDLLLEPTRCKATLRK